MEERVERSGFSIIEVAVVIMILAILIAVAVSILRCRNEEAKWLEGAVMAGSVRMALRIYYTKNPNGALATVGSAVNTVQETLGFSTGDLAGRYFQAFNFTIAAIDENGLATIKVTAPAGLSGSAVLSNAGWVYTP